MSHNALRGRVSQDAMRPSELRRFAIVLATQPAPITGVRVAGLESIHADAPTHTRRPLRRFAIRPR